MTEQVYLSSKLSGIDSLNKHVDIIQHLKTFLEEDCKKLPVNGDAHWNTMKEHDQRGN
jgi:hypothetical protein